MFIIYFAFEKKTIYYRISNYIKHYIIGLGKIIILI